MDDNNTPSIGRRIGEIRAWRNMSLNAVAELAEQAFPPAAADPVTGEAQATVIALEAALSDLDLGEFTDPAARPWPAVSANLNRLNSELRPTADYAAQELVLPGLLHELHTLYLTDPEHRRDILQASMDCHQAACFMVKNLRCPWPDGSRGSCPG